MYLDIITEMNVTRGKNLFAEIVHYKAVHVVTNGPLGVLFRVHCLSPIAKVLTSFAGDVNNLSTLNEFEEYGAADRKTIMIAASKFFPFRIKEKPENPNDWLSVSDALHGLRASRSLDLQGTSVDRFSSRIETTPFGRIARPFEFILSAAFSEAALSSAAGEVLSVSPLVSFSGFATGLSLDKIIKIINIIRVIKTITLLKIMNIIVTYSK
jgi:hypothetical protein